MNTNISLSWVTSKFRVSLRIFCPPWIVPGLLGSVLKKRNVWKIQNFSNTNVCILEVVVEPRVLLKKTSYVLFNI